MNVQPRYSRAESLWLELRRWRCRYLRAKKFRYLQEHREPNAHSEYSCRPFDQHRCIFIHIPKCAGISICKSLFGNLAGAHHSIGNYQLMFSPEEFASYFKFTFVRNPWDRLASAYMYMRDGGRTPSDRAFSEKHLKRFANFGDFIRNGITQPRILKAMHFRPQHQFICLLGKHLSVDFIGYFENLTEDFNFVANRLKIQTSLQQLNRTASKQQDFREYYTDETARIVGEVYATDVELFGYSFEQPAPVPAPTPASAGSSR